MESKKQKIITTDYSDYTDYTQCGSGIKIREIRGNSWLKNMIQSNETYNIIGAAMEVHSKLGAGFTEPVYQDALEVEMQSRTITFEREKRLQVSYKGVMLQHDYFVDFLCYDSVIVELKAVKTLADEHRAQILNYMKISNMRVGLLINFGELSLKFERFIL